MFEVKGGNIFHTRGDTADFALGVTVDGEPTTDYEGTFSIKKTLKDEAYLFTAPVVDGNVHISHDATKDLPFGRFFYDVQLRLNDGTEEGRYVTVGPFEYNLLPDVTR